MAERKGEILVTGSHGFIGKNFVLNSVDYRTLDSHSYSNPQLLSDKLNGVKAVIHLGALIRGTEEEQMEANVGNTVLLLEAISKISEGSRPKIVFASTFAVYGVQDEDITEDTITEPRNGYGKSKLEAERKIREYAGKFNFSADVLRFSNVYGPGMEPDKHSVIANFVYRAIDERPIEINGDGNQRRDFVYVTDVVDALNRAVNMNSKKGEIRVLNICSAESISLNELVSEIEKLSGTKIEVKRTNPDVVEKGNWIGKNDLAYAELGWKPHVFLRSGLKMTYESAKR